MNDPSLSPPRVLAIDPISRGFGYAVLEGPDTLVDWGICNARSGDADSFVRRVEQLVGLYRPGTFVVEDCDDPRCRRGERARLMIDRASMAIRNEVRSHAVPAIRLAELFGGDCPATKEQIAGAVADHFPDVRYRLPPRRKPWQPEDARLSIFDAIGFALAYYVTHSTNVCIPGEPTEGFERVSDPHDESPTHDQIRFS